MKFLKMLLMFISISLGSFSQNINAMLNQAETGEAIAHAEKKNEGFFIYPFGNEYNEYIEHTFSEQNTKRQLKTLAPRYINILRQQGSNYITQQDPATLNIIVQETAKSYETFKRAAINAEKKSRESIKSGALFLGLATLTALIPNMGYNLLNHITTISTFYLGALSAKQFSSGIEETQKRNLWNDIAQKYDAHIIKPVIVLKNLKEHTKGTFSYSATLPTKIKDLKL